MCMNVHTCMFVYTVLNSLSFFPKVRAVNGAGEGSWSPPGLTCPGNQYVHI